MLIVNIPALLSEGAGGEEMVQIIKSVTPAQIMSCMLLTVPHGVRPDTKSSKRMRFR
jgi:hypothetical protein